ncbi:hypothetical protein PG989_012021 [Apiospora arundinis]
MPLDQLPVTPNGKLDYAVLEALPLPEKYSSSSSPSATPTESDNEDVAAGAPATYCTPAARGQGPPAGLAGGSGLEGYGGGDRETDMI